MGESTLLVRAESLYVAVEFYVPNDGTRIEIDDEYTVKIEKVEKDWVW